MLPSLAVTAPLLSWCVSNCQNVLLVIVSSAFFLRERTAPFAESSQIFSKVVFVSMRRAQVKMVISGVITVAELATSMIIIDVRLSGEKESNLMRGSRATVQLYLSPKNGNSRHIVWG